MFKGYLICLIGIFFLRSGIMAEGNSQIGIYKGKGARILVPEPIVNTLLREGYRVEPVLSLELESLSKHKVLIMPQCTGLPPRDNHIYFDNLRSYVEDLGGSIIFYHDSVGYSRGAIGHIFPEIVKQAPIRRDLFKMKVITEHPITKGYKKGEWVKHLYYDHIIMEPGEKGIVLFEDELGGAVVVCGEVGKGRVVFNGTIIAHPSDDPKRQVKIATGVDKDILINSIRWLLEGEGIRKKDIKEVKKRIILKREEREKGKNFLIWQANPWNWSFTPEEKPSLDKELKEVSVSLCKNESEPITFMIHNPGKGTLDLRIKIDNLKNISSGEKISWQEHISIHEAVWVRTRLEREMVPDALPKLNEANIITIPSGKTRQLWLNIDSEGLNPGYYRTIISLNPLGMQKKKRIELRIKIWDFELPKDIPYIFLWDYELGNPALEQSVQKRFLELLGKAGVNMFQLVNHKELSFACDKEGNLLKKPDFSVWDKYIEWERKYAKVFILEVRLQGGLKPKCRKALKRYIRYLTEYFKSKGLSYDDWALYLWDEYIGPEYIKLGKVLREIDPKIKFFTTKLQPPQYLKEALPYIDIVSPHESFFLREDRKDDIKMVMKKFKKGKLIITTHTSGFGHKLYPPSFYRIKGWRSFASGINGVGYWSVGSGYAYVFPDQFDIQPGGVDVGTIYPTSSGCITSRRWEAFREGIEDYRYLYLLKEEIKKVKDEKVSKEAEKIMNQAIEEILNRPLDYSLYKKWRKRLAEEILKLNKGVKND